MVIGTDGVATVSSRGKETVRCKLEPALLTTIQPPHNRSTGPASPTKPSTQHPDDMILAVSANGKTARIEDPKVKPWRRR